MTVKTFPLKITSAVALGGVIHKAGSIVPEVEERVARDLLRRGKAVIHAEAQAQADASEDAADTEGQPQAEAGDVAQQEAAPAPAATPARKQAARQAAK